jgi:hypothetical protein
VLLLPRPLPNLAFFALGFFGAAASAAAVAALFTLFA